MNQQQTNDLKTKLPVAPKPPKVDRKEIVQSGASTPSTNLGTSATPSPMYKQRGQTPQPSHRQELLVGMSPAEAIKRYHNQLTTFEMTEINEVETIYTIGSYRVSHLMTQKDDGTYKAHVGEQLLYRYLVQKVCGKGAFGQVLQCRDMKEGGRPVAIKISKVDKGETENAQIESKILMRIVGQNPDQNSLIKIENSFFFRRHFFIVTEILDINLYQFLTQHRANGIPRDLLKNIAREMVESLKHLIDIKIIHCDLKPENILFKDASRKNIKIIDFGSACTEFKNGFTYVQSRYYRAPEVMLGVPYDHAIDMWSFGCILVELVKVRPIFPAKDEKDLLDLMRVTIGMPPGWMIDAAKKRSLFFDDYDNLIQSEKPTLKPGLPDKYRTLANELRNEHDSDFVDFVQVSIEC